MISISIYCATLFIMISIIELLLVYSIIVIIIIDLLIEISIEMTVNNRERKKRGLIGSVISFGLLCVVYQFSSLFF